MSARILTADECTAIMKAEAARPERIVAAAIQYGLAVVSRPAPNRHHDIIHAVFISFGRTTSGSELQGFLTSSGRFVERANAKLIAIKAGQLLDRASDSSELFSEDVW